MNLTFDTISAKLMPYCSAANNIIVGYSGGIDSHVLLQILSRHSDFKAKITAVYINHGLQADASIWAEHCQQIARSLGVKYLEIVVDAQAKTGESPEAAARNARYQAFKKILIQNDVLLFAQHRDDQLETVLLQLFRGAGLKGLSGMPSDMKFSQGILLRPLLEFTQEEIKQYAHQHHLHWIEDPSNQNTDFDRNFLRHQILPLLEPRWPGLNKTIARTAKHCADAQLLLSTSAKQKFILLYDAEKQCLSISALLMHDELTQQWVIREWLDLLDIRMPSQKVLAAILREVLLARADASPLVHHDNCTFRRYRNELYLVPNKTKPELFKSVNWIFSDSAIALPGNGVLHVKSGQQGIAWQVWQQGEIQVKYRQGGEKISLPNRTGRHSLKKLYQEAGIVPWQRDTIPLIYIDGKLAAIAGYWLSADFYSQSDACMQIFWEE